ncbi:MAG TPA: hypothetical protein VE008_07240 [Burkholderiales bacterium]|nr:hypothetical protein [Burkholderiales bacterium]
MSGKLPNVPAARRRAVWRSMLRERRIGDWQSLADKLPIRLAIVRDYHRRYRQVN